MSTQIFLGMPPPNVENWIKENFVPPAIPESDCLCFTCESPTGSVAMTWISPYGSDVQIPFQKLKTGNSQWQPWDGHIIDLVEGEKVYIKVINVNPYHGTNLGGYLHQFIIEGQIAASGNIMYLISPDGQANFDGNKMDTTENGFACLFAGCSGLTRAPELPATTLSRRTYDSMFMGCTSLTVAPNLPATVLPPHEMMGYPYYGEEYMSFGTYSDMFEGCTNMSKDIHMSRAVQYNYHYNHETGDVTESGYTPTRYGLLIDGQNIIYDL